MESKFVPIWYAKGVIDSDGWYHRNGVELEAKDFDFITAFRNCIKLYSNSKATIRIRKRQGHNDIFSMSAYDIHLQKRFMLMGLPQEFDSFSDKYGWDSRESARLHELKFLKYNKEFEEI